MEIGLNESPGAIAEALVEKIEEQRTELAAIREDNYRLLSENLTLRAMVTSSRMIGGMPLIFGARN